MVSTVYKRILAAGAYIYVVFSVYTSGNNHSVVL